MVLARDVPGDSIEENGRRVDSSRVSRKLPPELNVLLGIKVKVLSCASRRVPSTKESYQD
jgi:hypothetical protein